ncbi:hypothetical protein BBP40_005421 [Aspergillus hancockii]|nr:hypothetical protein BBP40_005421 [Aspergillus hancockii]
MSFLWKSGRLPLKTISTDTILPVPSWDDQRRMRECCLHVTYRFDDVLDPELLYRSLERLLQFDGWRTLGARLRMKEDGKLEYHVPAQYNAERPGFNYTVIKYPMDINQHPLAAKFPKANGQASLFGDPADISSVFMSADCPRRIEDWLYSDCPQLVIEVVLFGDATLLTVTFLHTLMDAMGLASFMKAWTAVVNGQEDQVPIFQVVGEDPMARFTNRTPATAYVNSSYLLTGFRLLIFFACYIFELIWHRGQNKRVICIPGHYVNEMRDQALHELAVQNKGQLAPFLSEGDVLLAWWLRALVRALKPSPNRLISTLNVFDIRSTALLESPSTNIAYITNAALMSITFLRAHQILREPLSFVASHIRRSLAQQRTLPQIEACFALQKSISRKNDHPPVFGESTSLLVVCTNWHRGSSRFQLRKIRCNRLILECSKCEEQHAECIYARRKPRRIVRTNVDRVASVEIALSTTQRRLERIEQNCHCHDVHKPLNTSSSDGITFRNALQYQIQPESSINHMGSNVELDASSPNLSPTFSSNIRLASSYLEPSWASSDSSVHALAFDMPSRMCNAVQANAKMVSLEPYMASISNRIWPSHGSKVRVSAERFDIDLSWEMFKRACHYAEKIELHSLDNSISPSSTGLSGTVLDAGRKGFWELVNMDLYFQLIHNMPPVVVPRWRDAKVNLPWLAEAGLQTGADITTARFLIDSRRTFVLMKFFQLLESAGARPANLVPKTEALCHNIEALYQDWEIVRHPDLVVAGVVLEGYTCILFMLCHVINSISDSPETGEFDPDIPKLPLALKASRYILEIVALLLTAFPSMGTTSVTFAVFQAHLPSAYLATNLLHSASLQGYGADAILLERVISGLKMISSDIAEVAPLSTAIENLNLKVRYRLRENGSKYAVLPALQLKLMQVFDFAL